MKITQNTGIANWYIHNTYSKLVCIIKEAVDIRGNSKQRKIARELMKKLRNIIINIKRDKTKNVELN